MALFWSIAPAQAQETPLQPLDFGKSGLEIPLATNRQRTPPRTVQLMTDALKRAGEVERAALVHDLSLCESHDALPALRTALGDPSPIVRAEAVRAVARLSPAECEDDIHRAVSDADPVVGREAILAGGLRRELPPIDTELTPAMRSAWIAATASDQELHTLAAGLPSLGQNLRLQAIERLAAAKCIFAAAAIAQYLKGGMDECVVSIRALASLDAREHWDAIRPLLSSPHAVVRREATLAAILLAPSGERVSVAISRLGDEDESVREAAAISLTRNPSPDAIPSLVQQLGSDDPGLHTAARDALVAVGQAAAPVAAEMLSGRDVRAQVDGSYILGRIKSELGFDKHIALLSSNDPDVVAQATESLGRIGRSDAAPAIDQLLRKLSAVLEARKSGAFAQGLIACGRLGDRTAFPLAIQHVSDGSAGPEARAAAAFAIGRLATGTEDTAVQALLARYYDREESPDVQFEALKALGQARFVNATAELQRISQTEFDPNLRWIAHWSLQRITCTTTPYSPPEHQFTPDVRRVDIAGEPGAAIRLDANLLLGPYVASSAWLPVHVRLSNPSEEAVAGFVAFKGARDGLNNFCTAVDVPARSALQLTLFVRFTDAQSSAADSTLGTVQWHATDGRLVARSPLLGRTIPPGKDTQAPAAFILRIHGPQAPSSRESQGTLEADDVAVSAGWLGPVLNMRLQSASIPFERAPQYRVGYDACPIILLDGFDPDSLDIAQRKALSDHVIAGGIVLVCAPKDAGSIRQTWLGRHMPVQPIAQRTLTAIATRSGQRMMMRDRIWVCEATVTDGHAVSILKDDLCVQAAFKQHGLGRFAFTSFPVNALEVENPDVEALWRSLLSGDRTRLAAGDLTTASRSVLSGLMGASAPPWWIAVGLAVGYVVTVIAVMSGVVVKDRVLAFRVIACVALVLAACIFSFTGVRQRGETRSEARWRISDVGSEAGLRTEYVSWTGEDRVSLSARNEFIRIRPLDQSTAAQVSMMPFSVSAGRSGIGGAPQVFQADGVETTLDITATARFTSSGLVLDVSNQLGEPLEDVRLVWRGEASLRPLPMGQSMVLLLPGSAQAMRANSATAAAMNALSGSMDAASAPYLIGRLDHALSADLSMLALSSTPVTSHRLDLVRAPVQLEAPEAGASVRIDGAFNSIVLKQREGCPYDPQLRRWLPSTQSGQWLLGFFPPSSIGKLATRRVTVSLNAAAPRQRIRLQRNQCVGGDPTVRTDGPDVADWDGVISSRELSFECAEGDIDRNGCVWLLMTVDSPESASWLIRALELTYEGTVAGARE